MQEVFITDVWHKKIIEDSLWILTPFLASNGDVIFYVSAFGVFGEHFITRKTF